LSHPEALKNIKLIISLDIITDELRNETKKHKVEIAHFTDIENEGKNSRKPTNPPSKDTIATICYTSGVTGIKQENKRKKS
jgi:long-subunit acyl-CoA synthetase (AMP-forming)